MNVHVNQSKTRIAFRSILGALAVAAVLQWPRPRRPKVRGYITLNPEN